MKSVVVALTALVLCLPALADEKIQGWCQDGGYTVSTPGNPVADSTTEVQRSFASCTVTVYDAGTLDLATIYSDNAGSAKANPFTAANTGQWFFYADNGRYDVRFSGGGISVPFTLGDFSAFDESDLWVNVKDYGALGDGSTDDTTAIQNALNERQYTVFPPGTYIISAPLDINRGNYLYGFSANDNATNPGVIIKLADGTDTSMLRTPVGQGGAATHYMWLENLVFDANGQNQTAENVAVDFRGVFIMGGMRNVFIDNSLGPGLYFGQGGDFVMDHVWVIGSSTSTYAVVMNQAYAGATAGGLMDIRHLFIENTTTLNAGAYRETNPADATTRGKALYLNRTVMVNIINLHIEDAKVGVDIAQSRVVNIVNASGTRIGDDADADPSMRFFIRFLDLLTFSFNIGPTYVDQSGGPAVSGVRLVGLADGVTSNIWWETPADETIMSGYNTGNAAAGAQVRANYLGYIPEVGHRLDIRQVGSGSPDELRLIRSTADTDYIYYRLNGDKIVLGSTIAQPASAENNFLECQSFGNAGDRCSMLEPFVLAERGSAANLIDGHIFHNTANGTPQIIAPWDSTNYPIMLAETSNGVAPVAAPNHAGQLLVDVAGSKRMWIATGTGSVADWKRMVIFSDNDGSFIDMPGETFANLGAPGNGRYTYCTDCNVASPCTGSGSGAWAFRSAGAWECPF